MNVFAGHGARRALQASVAPAFKSNSVGRLLHSSARTTTPWVCPECTVTSPLRNRFASTYRTRWIRQLSTSKRLLEEPRTPISTATASSSSSPPDGNDILSASSSSLPSKTEARRWQVSKRLARIMDTLLARASVAGQHINIYTGTDYSGIEALRKEIIDQEKIVRDCHRSIDSARSTHHEAHTRQASAQKEIVGLLERKSSWTPTDLERYMSLVRSEHTNEQAVQTAKDGLAAAERELESARSLLERLERKQYHEEQIWSDTIRRNSTWVTFGLMGVNIILLLAQIAIFEPYRRRKIVREVQKALDQKTVAAPPEVAIAQGDVPSSEAIEVAAGTAPMPEQPLDAFVTPSETVGKTALGIGEVLPEEAAHVFASQSTESQSKEVPKSPGTWEMYMESLQDLFSERIIQIKKVDVTTTALQGAATGVAIMGMLFVVFRPR